MKEDNNLTDHTANNLQTQGLEQQSLHMNRFLKMCLIVEMCHDFPSR